MSFWWCLTHNAVEGAPDEDSGCRNQDRLGPYATADQASTALEQARARTAENDARDEAEDDWGR
ncbi:MAG: hypothetical protein AVDCRST_MAG16-3253 [uncultured Frankineae bacterium]|uniref:SPOR domain-containing protein n=1 Tax=uncultured Frankineae bacterium TaxID=437475 RepID=A0A6J4MNU2_9ACTN|nr:MAG: hypothetical protein AVDCRST_MAG16-3253 [uncultured Frankineae bacterium]